MINDIMLERNHASSIFKHKEFSNEKGSLFKLLVDIHLSQIYRLACLAVRDILYLYISEKEKDHISTILPYWDKCDLALW